MKRRSLSRRVAVLAGLLVAARSLAQQEAITPLVAGPGGHALAPARASAPSYGTTDLTYVRVTGIEFFPAAGSSGYAGGFLLSRHPINGPLLVAPVHLPNGSIIDYLEIDFCDSLDPQDIQLFLEDCGPLGLVCDVVANVNSFGAPGCSAISTSGFHHQVSDTGSSFGLRALFGAVNTTNLLITGAIVGYRLQVSPAPAVATFPNDVPVGHPFFQFVEALAAAGITVGTGPGTYGVNSPITRGQMAVFLAKALGLHWPN